MFHSRSDTNGSYSGSDWVWDAKCDVDEALYSFQLREYNPHNAPIEGVSLNILDSESPQTYRHRQEWEKQTAIVTHYALQVKEMKAKQRSLFRSLSTGFNGNLKRTVAHVTAIHRACKDIEIVEALIGDLSNHAKAKRCDYLASLTEDDQRVLIEAEDAQRGAQERLATIDPKEIAGIQTEQALIRVSKERISLLQTSIAGHAHEMNELAAVAQRLRDEGSESVSDGTVVTKRSGQKGKKRAQPAQESKRQLPGTVAGDSIPKYLFPSVPTVIAEAAHLHIAEEPDEDCEG